MARVNISTLLKHKLWRSQAVRAIFLALVAIICAKSFDSQANVKTKVDKGIEQRVNHALEKMSLEEKIGQVFVFGFRGTQINASIESWFNGHQPGSIILFRRNLTSPYQTARLTRGLQRLSQKQSGVPLLIMVDQEGGSVSRLQLSPTPPSALALGKTEDQDLIEDIGKNTGLLLKAIGINMNLAPVLDIAPANQKTFVGNRSFGADPHQVAAYATGFSKGLLAAGVLPTGKHFPGHGGLLEDSHKSLPVSTKATDEILEHDLIPFVEFAGLRGPTAIMAAHIAFPKVDPKGLPASFSKPVIEGLLRKRLNYQGLIVTDDIEMSGAEQVGGLGERAIRAFEAGCDIIMVAWSPRRQTTAQQALFRAVKSGRISTSRLNESVKRILLAKFAIEPNAEIKPITQSDLRRYQNLSTELKRKTREVTKRNFNRSSSDYRFLRESLTGARRYVVFASDPAFAKHLRSTSGLDFNFVRLTRGMDLDLDSHFSSDERTMGIFYLTGSGTARILETLSNDYRHRVLVMNAAAPKDIVRPEDYWAVINSYSANVELGKLLGEFFFYPSLGEEPGPRLPAGREGQSMDPGYPPN